MPLTGQMKLQTTFLLPAGEADVPERLQLDGAFSIEHARFTSFNVQKRIDTLSRRGRGETDDTRPERRLEPERSLRDEGRPHSSQSA